jgi:RNA polymerase sigma-70 factor (ECF subfamily)
MTTHGEAGARRADLDGEDVRRVVAGDLAGFEGIVARWQGPLVNLAYRFVRDRSRAEDLAQEAFLHAFRNLARFRGDAAFSTWLFAVAVNVYRSELRRRPTPTVPIEAAGELASGERPLSAALEAGEREELVRRAVAALPARYRDPLIVYYFRDMDLAETAAILGVPAGTAKALLHRGRNLLRQRLGGGGSPRHPLPKRVLA